jgi:hypothetical protein
MVCLSLPSSDVVPCMHTLLAVRSAMQHRGSTQATPSAGAPPLPPRRIPAGHGRGGAARRGAQLRCLEQPCGHRRPSMWCAARRRGAWGSLPLRAHLRWGDGASPWALAGRLVAKGLTAGCGAAAPEQADGGMQPGAWCCAAPLWGNPALACAGGGRRVRLQGPDVPVGVARPYCSCTRNGNHPNSNKHC